VDDNYTHKPMMLMVTLMMLMMLIWQKASESIKHG